ncbi:MAG: hypothetical protein C0518_10450, partial [Opitutus sp.]|nr:hypothetical protein [Opitutus sp.]
IGGRKMKKLKIVCAVLGLLHAVVMTAFALGPELSPLMVLIVDAPVAHFTKDLASPVLALGVPIAACSVLYPAVIFLAGALMARLAPREPIQTTTANDLHTD